MAEPKYKKQYDSMMSIHKDLFNKLKTTPRGTDEFKDIQKQLIRIVHKNEDALCSKTESGHLSKFSTNLAEKFMQEVRANYPEIDYSN